LARTEEGPIVRNKANFRRGQIAANCRLQMRLWKKRVDRVAGKTKPIARARSSGGAVRTVPVRACRGALGARVIVRNKANLPGLPARADRAILRNKANSREVPGLRVRGQGQRAKDQGKKMPIGRLAVPGEEETLGGVTTNVVWSSQSMTGAVCWRRADRPAEWPRLVELGARSRR